MVRHTEEVFKGGTPTGRENGVWGSTAYSSLDFIALETWRGCARVGKCILREAFPAEGLLLTRHSEATEPTCWTSGRSFRITTVGDWEGPPFSICQAQILPMPESELPQYLDPKQFAEKVQMHRQTVYQKLRSGDVPGARKMGGRWKIPRWAIDEMGVPAHLATA